MRPSRFLGRADGPSSPERTRLSKRKVLSDFLRSSFRLPDAQPGRKAITSTAASKKPTSSAFLPWETEGACNVTCCYPLVLLVYPFDLSVVDHEEAPVCMRVCVTSSRHDKRDTLSTTS